MGETQHMEANLNNNTTPANNQIDATAAAAAELDALTRRLTMFLLVALLSLTGCAVVVAPVEDDPAQEPVGARQMVQQRSAAAAPTPAPQPEPKPQPEQPQPLDAVASSSSWSLLPLSAGTLAGGVLTSIPDTCDAVPSVTAELQIPLAPWRGRDCSVMLTGELGLLRLRPATVPTGTGYTCTQAADVVGSINVGDGGGWGEFVGGVVKLPPNAIYLPTLTGSIGLRFRLRGDSAAHLGEVSATIHCSERL